jgi:hypothetical protein
MPSIRAPPQIPSVETRSLRKRRVFATTSTSKNQKWESSGDSRTLGASARRGRHLENSRAGSDIPSVEKGDCDDAACTGPWGWRRRQPPSAAARGDAASPCAPPIQRIASLYSMTFSKSFRTALPRRSKVAPFDVPVFMVSRSRALVSSAMSSP